MQHHRPDLGATAPTVWLVAGIFRRSGFDVNIPLHQRLSV
jgi:hypothetical protein